MLLLWKVSVFHIFPETCTRPTFFIFSFLKSWTHKASCQGASWVCIYPSLGTLFICLASTRPYMLISRVLILHFKFCLTKTEHLSLNTLPVVNSRVMLSSTQPPGGVCAWPTQHRKWLQWLFSQVPQHKHMSRTTLLARERSTSITYSSDSSGPVSLVLSKSLDGEWPQEPSRCPKQPSLSPVRAIILCALPFTLTVCWGRASETDLLNKALYTSYFPDRLLFLLDFKV